MARVTGAEVKEIIDTTLTAAECASFITAANLVVTDRLANSGLSAAHKKEVERWLTAHLIYMRDPKLRSEKIGDAQDTYDKPVVGQNLQASPYGQQVLILDTSGNMANLGKRRAVIETIYDSSSSSSA